jgi:hypothetical protein
MINGETVRNKLATQSNRIGLNLNAGRGDCEILADVYLAALARQPTEIERSAVLEHLGRARDRHKAWEDVVWALLNSKEFLLRH